jgi:hypothetical protein
MQDMKRIFQAIALTGLLSATAQLSMAGIITRMQWRRKADATNPATRAWYLNEMRPAFSRLVGPALVECVGKTNYSMANGIGLVFSVTPAGDAKQIFWKAENNFTGCVGEKIKTLKFPASPR